MTEAVTEVPVHTFQETTALLAGIPALHSYRPPVTLDVFCVLPVGENVYRPK